MAGVRRLHHENFVVEFKAVRGEERVISVAERRYQARSSQQASERARALSYVARFGHRCGDLVFRLGK